MKVFGALIEHGRTVIEELRDATGEGVPESGEVFGRAQSAFDDVNETLGSAAPGDWDGPGSHAYADQNSRQQLRSEAMAGADREVHKVLSREAAQIARRRGSLDDQCGFLTTTSQVAFSPQYGDAMNLTIEIAALQSALGESCHQINQLRSEVAQNAAELQQAVGRYASVADTAELPRLDADNPAALTPRDGI